MSDDNNGNYIWHELLTTDPEAAKAFYTKVVGWGTTLWENGDNSYLMWTVGEQPVGGVMKLPDEALAEGARPHWLPYVQVGDVDATVERATGLGARTYVSPSDIPTVGRFAVLADPQGATFAVFRPAEDMPAQDGPPKHGQFTWHELGTTDYAAAIGFYSELFGWVKGETMDMGEGAIYQMYGRGAAPLGGMFNKPPEMPGPPMWMVYAHVPDVDTLADTIKAEGGQILVGPMDVPGGDRIIQLMDPQGAAIAIHSPKPA